MPTVVGTFLDHTITERAVETLVLNGVQNEAIRVMWRDRPVSGALGLKVVRGGAGEGLAGTEARKGTVGGAIGGAVAGSVALVLAMAGVEVLPGIEAWVAPNAFLSALTVIAGAGIGGALIGAVLGLVIGATERGTAPVIDSHTAHVDTAERDGFVVTVRVIEENLPFTVQALEAVGAAEVSVFRGWDI